MIFIVSLTFYSDLLFQTCILPPFLFSPPAGFDPLLPSP
jgi:hypothetical protein